MGLLDGVTAFALKPFMDYVVGKQDWVFHLFGNEYTLTWQLFAFLIPFAVVAFAGVQGVLRYLNDYISAWTSAHITNNVKFDLFHKLVHMDPQFFDENSSGIVISRYMGDPTTASAGIVDNIKTITTSLFGALGLIAVMLYSSWRLALVGVIVLNIAFLPVALIRKRIKNASNKNMVIGGNITTNINETYSGNKVMAAYGLQDRQEEYFIRQTWDSYNVGMSLLKRAGWMSPLMYLIASIGIAIVLAYGTSLINNGIMTAGSFASFVTSLLLLYKPVKTLGNTLTGIQNIFVAMGRVFELFDLEPEIKDSANALELKGFDKEIKFEDVCFEYIPNQPVLKNINLTIPKNETLAIVGNSGGGKSTLVNLLPRFYDIKSGAITIDGKDIKWWKDKGGKEATFELISRLNNGENVAVTVDGPSGPLHQVKNGVIKIAKLTGAPIIPVVWYSKSRFLSSLPTWDKIKIPLWFLKSVNIYGKPIYVPETATKEEENQIKEHLRQTLCK